MSLAETRSLKSLLVTRSKLMGWRKACRTTRDRAAADLLDAEKQLGEINAKIAAIENGDHVVVSEHAILRYLERFENVDINKVSEQVQALDPTYIVKRGNTIVTIIDGDPLSESQEHNHDTTK